MDSCREYLKAETHDTIYFCAVALAIGKNKTRKTQ